MSNFLFAFRGGSMPADPKEQQAIMEKWTTWMTGLGAAMVNPGAILGASRAVTAVGVDLQKFAEPLGGFMIVAASDDDEAVAIAQSCPILANGGSIEVAVMVEM